VSPIIREKKKERVQLFSAGEDSTSEPGVVKSPFASLARGCDIGEAGKVIQRLGPSRTGDDPDTRKLDMRFHDSAATDFEANITAANTTENSITYNTGKFGLAAYFNGTTSNISIAASQTEISSSTMVDFVITVWCYINSDGENDLGAIFDKVGATTAGYRAWTSGQSGSVVFLNFEVQHATTDAIVTTSTTVATGSFKKLEFHSNADDSLDIYIDGVIASYSTDTSGSGAKSDDTANPLTIGDRAAGARGFDGRLEYFRIYDGVRVTTEFEQDKIFGLTRFKVGSTIDKLYRIRDTNLEALDTNFKAWTEIDTGFTADKTTNFVQAFDLLFILNATEAVHSMNSSESMTDEGAGNEEGGGTATNPPKSGLGAWSQNNRLFLSGHPTQLLNCKQLFCFSFTT